MKCVLYLCACILSLCTFETPNHCVKQDIIGTWRFYISNTSFVPNVTDPRLACGHHQPNQFQYYTANAFPHIESPIEYTAIISQTSVQLMGNSKEIIGSWTMVYDQAFELQFPLFTIYSKLKYIANNLTDANYIPLCNETQEGWIYNISSSTHGCLYGYKLNSTVPQPISNVEIPQHISLKQLKKEIIKINNIIQTHAKWNSSLYDIEEAKVLKYLQNNQQNHRKFTFKTNTEAKTNYDNQKLKEVLQYYREKVSKDNPFYDRLVTDITDFNSVLLPKEYSWKNVSNHNYLSAVRDQSCGDCFVIAAVESLEARINILHAGNSVELSTHEVVNCNFYDEGCDGGTPYSVHKYLQEFGVHEAKCSNSNRQTCNQIQSHCKKSAIFKYVFK